MRPALGCRGRKGAQRAGRKGRAAKQGAALSHTAGGNRLHPRLVRRRRRRRRQRRPDHACARRGGACRAAGRIAAPHLESAAPFPSAGRPAFCRRSAAGARLRLLPAAACAARAAACGRARAMPGICGQGRESGPAYPTSALRAARNLTGACRQRAHSAPAAQRGRFLPSSAPPAQGAARVTPGPNLSGECRGRWGLQANGSPRPRRLRPLRAPAGRLGLAGEWPPWVLNATRARRLVKLY